MGDIQSISFRDLFTVRDPVIGMLHAPPLPGSPWWTGNSERVLSAVLNDAARLFEGGVHGLLLENFGDAPFTPGRVPAETVAALAWLATEVRSRFRLPLGLNVLRNDGRSAMAIAAAVGAGFIRVNVLCGVRATDQGLVEGIAYDLLRDRARLQSRVAILADVDVKHSAPLSPRPLAEEVDELLHRGGADGLIVTGVATGSATSLETLRQVKSLAGAMPVLVGSGVSAANLRQFLPAADGVIVGTSIKEQGGVLNPVDPRQVRELMQAWQMHRHQD